MCLGCKNNCRKYINFFCLYFLGGGGGGGGCHTMPEYYSDPLACHALVGVFWLVSRWLFTQKSYTLFDREGIRASLKPMGFFFSHIFIIQQAKLIFWSFKHAAHLNKSEYLR